MAKKEVKKPGRNIPHEQEIERNVLGGIKIIERNKGRVLFSEIRALIKIHTEGEVNDALIRLLENGKLGLVYTINVK